MKNKIITAVSFFYEGERHVVKCTTTGKFRVPVTEVIEGRVRTKNKSLTVVEDFDFDTPKTKSFTAVLDALGVSDKKSLLVLGSVSKNVYMSARNLQHAEVVTDAELSTYKIVNAQHLILAESAVNSINSNLNTK